MPTFLMLNFLVIVIKFCELKLFDNVTNISNYFNDQTISVDSRNMYKKHTQTFKFLPFQKFINKKRFIYIMIKIFIRCWILVT